MIQQTRSSPIVSPQTFLVGTMDWPYAKTGVGGRYMISVGYG